MWKIKMKWSLKRVKTEACGLFIHTKKKKAKQKEYDVRSHLFISLLKLYYIQTICFGQTHFLYQLVLSDSKKSLFEPLYSFVVCYKSSLAFNRYEQEGKEGTLLKSA